jgi:hypothetical protein
MSYILNIRFTFYVPGVVLSIQHVSDGTVYNNRNFMHASRRLNILHCMSKI